MASQNVTHEAVPFSYISDAREGRLNLSLHGELDLACSDLLSRLADEDDADLREVVVDVTDLEFIDTAGVRALAEVQSRNQLKGRTVEISESSSLVRRVIRLFGREDMLPATR
jgi:anti-anti-sigma factor